MLNFREIVLGDHVVGEDPDCNRFGCLPKVFKRQVKSYKIHENYQPGSVDSPYDLALIRLDRLVPVYEPENNSKSGVVPVCIPWRQNDPGRRLTTRADLLVTGWGRVTNNPRINSNNYRRFGAGSRVLKKLKVPAISRRKCSEIEIFKNLNTDLQICAGGVEGMVLIRLIS